MKKESLTIITVKILLAVVIFTGIGTIIIGGGYLIGEYSKNKNKIVKLVNQETYYQKLVKDCEKFKKSKLSTDYDCCLQSVEAMKNGNFRLASKNECQKGFQANSFWCGGSYNWCEPIRKSTWKNCEQDSDCVETRADCCNCNNGGEQIGVNKKYLKVWENAMKNKCQDVDCIALFSCRKGEVVCEDNQCEFKEEINNNDDQLDTFDWQTYRNEDLGFELKHPLDAIVYREYNDKYNKLVIFTNEKDNFEVRIKDGKSRSLDEYHFLDFPVSSKSILGGKEALIFKAPYGYCDGPGCGAPFIAYSAKNSDDFYNLVFYGDSDLDDMET
ncbi:hypothetical protein GQ568_03030, partial [Patescibacteria group bacterium]|nr:hypothetical protein [Patescibacteria group bacterium]